MSDQPPVPLGHWKPDPRQPLGRQSTLILLFVVVLFSAIWSWREERARRARDAEVQQWMNSINNHQDFILVRRPPPKHWWNRFTQ